MYDVHVYDAHYQLSLNSLEVYNQKVITHIIIQFGKQLCTQFKKIILGFASYTFFSTSISQIGFERV
jgi:hypothetical protein